MKVKLNVIVSNAANNINITLQHTGVNYPTSTIVHECEIEIPELPAGFSVESITMAGE